MSSRLYDFCTIIECQMKIHVFENYMVIYTGRKMDEKKRRAKFADCWVKARQKLSLNLIQCTERILFHMEHLSDGYLILKRVGLVLKTRPVQGRPVSATSENDVATVQSIVQQDSGYTVEETSDLSGLSSSYVLLS